MNGKCDVHKIVVCIIPIDTIFVRSSLIGERKEEKEKENEAYVGELKKKKEIQFGSGSAPAFELSTRILLYIFRVARVLAY